MKGSVAIERVVLRESQLDGINKNPVQECDAAEPFVISPPIERQPGLPFCEFCSCHFDTFSLLCAHQARRCDLSLDGPAEQTVRILIRDAEIARLVGLPYEPVVVDRRLAEVRRRSLHVTLISRFNLEQYYHLISDHTAKSVWKTLSAEEMSLVKRLCSLSLSASLGMVSRETQAEAQGREALEDALDSLIASVGGSAFVKLSTRSPKDAPVDSLQVTSGSEALALLTRSQRIFKDLGMLERYGDGVPVAIVVREWIPMAAEKEFRCVARNGRLAAISQYNCYQPMKEDVVEGIAEILRVFDRIKEPLFGLYHQEFVIDFALLDDGRAHVVEINPQVSSGIGLFSWAELENLSEEEMPRVRVLDRVDSMTDS